MTEKLGLIKRKWSRECSGGSLLAEPRSAPQLSWRFCVARTSRGCDRYPRPKTICRRKGLTGLRGGCLCHTGVMVKWAIMTVETHHGGCSPQRLGTAKCVCAKEFHPSFSFIPHQLPACGMSVHIQDWSFQNLPGHTQMYASQIS